MPKSSGAADKSPLNDTGSERDASITSSHSSTADTSMTERIAKRAYERFEMRGREHGRDQEDWFEAEIELREQG